MLYAFAGFNGYLLLGHYLKNLDWSMKKTLATGIPMFVIGYVVTFFGFRHMTALPDSLNPAKAYNIPNEFHEQVPHK